MMAVVESRLSSDENRAFTEAKRKALVPWHEHDAWQPATGTISLAKVMHQITPVLLARFAFCCLCCAAW